MINKDFFLALEELERENGIPQEEFLAALTNGLITAYKKQTGDGSGIELRLNPEKKTIRIFSTKTIVEEVVDEEKEISLEQAKEIKKSYKAGDVIAVEIFPKEFGRIAAGAAKSIVQQKIREIERTNTMSEYEDKEGELLTGIVRRIEDKTVNFDLCIKSLWKNYYPTQLM